MFGKKFVGTVGTIFDAITVWRRLSFELFHEVLRKFADLEVLGADKTLAGRASPSASARTHVGFEIAA